MTAPALLLPNTDLVGVAWLRRNPKLSDKGIGIGTVLPSDDAALRAGFIQTTVVGGSPEEYVPIRRPVITVSAWAAPASPGSTKTPWPQAFQIAEWVWEQTHDAAHRNVTLTFSLPGYARARVFTVSALTEPRRVPGDEGNYARVDLDVQINWTGV
jgi:hypothetical protein